MPWHRPNMRVARSRLWAAAKGYTKKFFTIQQLGYCLFEDVTTWDLVVWMSVLDVVGKTTSSPSSEGAFWACQRCGMPEHMVIQVVPLVKRRTAAFLLTDPGTLTGSLAIPLPSGMLRTLLVWGISSARQRFKLAVAVRASDWLLDW